MRCVARSWWYSAWQESHSSACAATCCICTPVRALSRYNENKDCTSLHFMTSPQRWHAAFPAFLPWIVRGRWPPHYALWLIPAPGRLRSHRVVVFSRSEEHTSELQSHL